jgi:hypothetical protein
MAVESNCADSTAILITRRSSSARAERSGEGDVAKRFMECDPARGALTVSRPDRVLGTRRAFPGRLGKRVS